MGIEFVNRICPNCKNPNYMIWLGDVSKVYKYKCMNCNRYFNDIDFEKEPLQPALESDCMKSKVDMVEVVRCKDCKYRFENLRCYANNPMIGRLVGGNWFCADGERR